jgi:hypothetical protein
VGSREYEVEIGKRENGKRKREEKMMYDVREKIFSLLSLLSSLFSLPYFNFIFTGSH